LYTGDDTASVCSALQIKLLYPCETNEVIKERVRPCFKAQANLDPMKGPPITKYMVNNYTVYCLALSVCHRVCLSLYLSV